ncbi:putative transcription factor bHLH family [Helianthus anomalus]
MDQTPYDLIVTEKYRRQQMNEIFFALRNLIPNPTKGLDRASVVKDAIIYINELKQTAKELKILMEWKRCNKERMKKHKVKDDCSHSF